MSTKAARAARNALVLLALIFVCTIFSASLGSAKIPFSHAFEIICSRLPVVGERFGPSEFSEQETAIVLQIRLPRIVLALVVGMALAVAGAVFQSLFRNPMADPYVIGVSAGASVGATASIVLRIGSGLLGAWATSASAFIGAVGATFAVYRISKIGKKTSIYNLLLSGLALGAFLASITSFLLMVGQNDAHKVLFWMLGALSGADWRKVTVALPPVFLSFLLLLLFSRQLNLFLLGEERAAQLGLDVEKAKLGLLSLASFVAAVAVSVSGLIGFVGLMTPHIVRLITGPDHRVLVPTTAMSGALLLLLSDTVARVAFSPREIPVGVITAAIGAPFFIYLLRSRGG